MKTQCSLLVYDIPASLRIPNPTARLRRIGVRINLSCWVIPDDKIPYTYLNDLQALGVTWHTVKFDASESGKLVALAIGAVVSDIKATIKSLQDTERKAAKAADKKTATAEEKRAYKLKVQGAISRARRLLKDAKSAAASFGITSIDTASPMQAIYSLKAASNVKAYTYAKSADALERVGGVHGKAMARAVRADELPAGIAADYLEETGETDAAASLREVFS